MLRDAVFLALIGGAGFGVWNSFPDTSRSALNWAVSGAHAMVCKPEELSANQPAVTKAQRVVLQTAASIPDDRFLISKETLAAITCGPWDVSEAGMEAILQEMLRRGWTPPSGSTALEASRRDGVSSSVSIPTDACRL